MFALMHMLGYRFAPRIRDLCDAKFFVSKGRTYTALRPTIGGTMNLEAIRSH
ncbi:Tn3 family transposase [Burkholderia cenocepacia]|uniref:Tn3 family transposase n=1 Tax=Burkholderia cenocepacia TaxID=95486 RepID=UPI00286F6357|nr:Tn3 family transposase [Burkholderia cenocepacia]